jgi:2-dehydropantoate 2-reductase
MRILVLGAGGIGGYFGARLQEAGADVTFLVRTPRAAQLRKGGLAVFSSFGDVTVTPKVLTREELRGPFDLIVLSCKAYDLESAMDAIAPAIGERSVILPLLNGIRHMELLDQRFGATHVLGGVAQISVTLGAEGEIRHLNPMHRFTAGARGGVSSPWLAELAQVAASARFDFVLSDAIEQAMWNKFVFLTTLAGATCLFRGSVGDIVASAAGEPFVTALFEECASVAAASGFPTPEAQAALFHKQLTERGSALIASMLRDVERGGPTEADHILGDMHNRAKAKGVAAPSLALAYSHLQVYAARRAAAS